MGVDCTTYTVFGVKLPYDRDLITGLNFDDHTTFYNIAIVDGMSGRYMVFGKKLWESSEEDDGDFVEIDTEQLENAKEEYIEEFREKLPNLMDLASTLERSRFTIMSFKHYA